jgi:hypothetical protein
LSSLILSNLKHELLNRLRSSMAANVLKAQKCRLDYFYQYNGSGVSLFIFC